MAPLTHCIVGEVEDAVSSTVSDHPAISEDIVMAFIFVVFLLVITAYMFVSRRKRDPQGFTEDVRSHLHLTPAVGRTPVQDIAVPVHFGARVLAMAGSPPSILDADTDGPITLTTYPSLAYIPRTSSTSYYATHICQTSVASCSRGSTVQPILSPFTSVETFAMPSETTT